DWDIEEQAIAQLAGLGLQRLELNRDAQTLSGGELTLTALGAQLIRQPDILLLDEPTNNLDTTARAQLYDALDAWNGVALIVSHDRELLRRVETIAEFRDQQIVLYGGNFDDYLSAVSQEQIAARSDLRTAESDLRKQKRELIDTHIKLDRRARYGKKMAASKREPKVVMGQRKRQAQQSAGKLRNVHLDTVQRSKDAAGEAERRIRDDDQITIDLPDTSLAVGRTVVDIEADHVGRLIIRGPERIAVTGDNGSGKTKLLRHLVANSTVPIGTLPQRLDFLDEELSVLENMQRHAPAAAPGHIRNRLAQFLLRGDQVFRPASTLSGGERFRAILATVLLAEPAPQLLLLDEPTNNLDLASVEQLRSALNSYQGALVVVSHDAEFLSSLQLDKSLHLPRPKPVERSGSCRLAGGQYAAIENDVALGVHGLE
ncbi:MAG: ATP-binding cassette domain-containing protein, partial [Antricoccus sp.]